MLRKITFTFGALFIFIIIAGIVLPNDYIVSRSITIASPTQEIHPYIEDLEQWPKWTPWQDADPNVKIELGEKTVGVGATQKWISSDSDAGQLEIMRADPNYGIDYNLSFDGGGGNTKSSISYQNEGTSTVVTWTMSGEMPIPVLGAYIAMVMDGTAGPMFENGLEKLKSIIEIPEGTTPQ